MSRPHPPVWGRPALMCYHRKEYDKIPIRGLTADGGRADPRRDGGWSTVLGSHREKERESDGLLFGQRNHLQL